MSNLWAIGDCHGCHKELMLLWDKLLKNGLDPQNDVVVWLGDYIDRGKDGKKVVQQLIDWHKQYPQFVFLYGNHEDIFRDWLQDTQRYGISNWFGNGGKVTYESYGGHFGKQTFKNGKETWEAPKTAKFPKKHLDFLFKETVYMYETDKYVFLHGGLYPKMSIEENKNYPDNLIWARENFIDSDYDWGKKVIFGHTPAYRERWGKMGYPIVMPNKIGIDCCVCPSGCMRLCAVELPTEKFYYQEYIDS